MKNVQPDQNNYTQMQISSENPKSEMLEIPEENHFIFFSMTLGL